MVHHNDAGSQYTSFAFTSRLIDADVDASVGSVGDGYDNALAETTIGLYKTRRSTAKDPGAPSPTASSPRSNGSTGSITNDCTEARGTLPRSSSNLSISKR